MYLNENLPFQNKVVGIDCVDKDPNDKSIIPLIYDLFCHIYGVVILIFGEKKTLLNMTEFTDKKVIEYSRDILQLSDISQHVEILPFPKK